MTESGGVEAAGVEAETANRAWWLPLAGDATVAQDEVPSAGGAAWMLTFTDLVALMLTFFVMLFAMSKVEMREWENLTDSLAPDLNVVSELSIALPTERRDVDSVETLPSVDLDYLTALLKQDMADDPLLSLGILRRLERRILIALPGDMLFAPGSTELAATGSEALIGFVGLLRHVNNRIEVMGHADPRQPTGGFGSNWELSLARALRVAQMLREAGYPGRVVARGFGHSRFESLSPRLKPAQRLTLGRRVELVIHDDAGELR